MSDNDKTRRRFLALTGSTAAAALAGCSGEDGTGEATEKEDMTEAR